MKFRTWLKLLQLLGINLRLAFTVLLLGIAINCSAQILTDASDSKPLGSRIPLLLVHGWNSNVEKWNQFSEELRKQKDVLAKYKPYRFQYNYKQHISSNGDFLRECIQQKRFSKVAVVAHSMGGLVARSCFESQSENWNGPNVIDRLITFGTPHHGTPLANVAWLQNASTVEEHDSILWLLSKSSMVPLDNDGGYALGWNNLDRLMPQKVWNGTGIPAANRFTRELNDALFQKTDSLTLHKLLSRYFVYGGYLTDIDRNWRKAIDSDLNNLLPKYSKPMASVLAFALKSETGEVINSYGASDGVVPLQSSLMLKMPGGADEPIYTLFESTTCTVEVNISRILRRSICPIKQNRLFPNVDHSELPINKSVIAAALGDLLVPIMEAPNASAPILVIDRSGSITGATGVMHQMETQAEDVVNAIRKTVNEAAVINFSGQGSATIDAPFTSDPSKLLNAIRSPSVASTGTALYDAIKASVDLAALRKEKPMLIVFTDGMNNEGSRLADAIQYCQRKGVTVVAIGFKGTEGRNEEDLQTLAAATGGFYLRSEIGTIEDLLKKFAFFKTIKDDTRPEPPEVGL